MNRKELMSKYFEFLSVEGLKPEEVVVGFGGAMVMWGLREETGDLDLSLDEVVFERIVGEKGLVVKELKQSVSKCLAEWDECVDIHPGELGGVLVDGVMVDSLEKILQGRLFLNREKDKKDIEKLKVLLGY
jgi:hypothetical protein